MILFDLFNPIPRLAGSKILKKMTIQEILKAEDKNDNNIIMHKEGVFWRMYEGSAFLFVHNLKAFYNENPA